MFTAKPIVKGEPTDSKTKEMEIAQSLNWGAVRLKIPLHETEGWRLEIRVCEAQITDFQNAAFAIFMVLFAKIVEFYNLDLRLPISLVRFTPYVTNYSLYSPPRWKKT